MKKLLVILILISNISFGQGLPSTGGSYIPGLKYQYTFGAWTSTSMPIPVEGFSSNFNLGLPLKTNEYSIANFDGYINCPKDAIYIFYLRSINGARMSVDGIDIIFNDTFHVSSEKSGSLTLAKGMHSIHVDYFQQYKNTNLLSYWKVGSASKTLLPDSVLFRKAPTDTIPDVIIKGIAMVTVTQLVNGQIENPYYWQNKAYKIIKEKTDGSFEIFYKTQYNQPFANNQIIWQFIEYSW